MDDLCDTGGCLSPGICLTHWVVTMTDTNIEDQLRLDVAELNRRIELLETRLLEKTNIQPT